VQIRFEDLIADPIGQLKHAYAALGYAWTPKAEQRFRRYLATVRDYTPRHGAASQLDTLEPPLRELAARFGHDRPAVEHAPAEHQPRPSRTGLATVATIASAVALAGIWLLIAGAMHTRHEVFIWIIGVMLGLVAIRVAGRGSTRLGITAAACLALIVLPALYPITSAAYSHRWSPDEVAQGTKASVLRMLTRPGDLIYIALGLISAYRVGSRQHVRPPGT
jgi:hypothetical protein